MILTISTYILSKYWYFLCLAVISAVNSCSGLAERKREAPINQYNEKPELELCIDHLDDKLNENSGIILYQGYLWTINDSGGKPVLYAVHPKTGKIIQSVSIANAKNRDWEDIAQDNDYIYIGDFGNNKQKRKELYIYIIRKQDLSLRQNDDLEAQVISFTYTDIPGSTSRKHRISPDCEAFFAWNDSLYIFTKDWSDETTTMYVLPSQPGYYTVYSRDIFPADGLITGADISRNGKMVVLTGYKDYIPFTWIFYDYQFPHIFDGKKARLDFWDYVDLQTEGVAILNPQVVFISSEMSVFPQQLYRLDVSDIIE